MAEEKTKQTRGPKKAKAHYIYSIIGVALVLFLLGILGWLVLNASELSKAFKENLEISVIFNDNTDDKMALKLQGIIDQQAFTKSSTFITKEKAAEQFKKDFSEDFVQVIDYNPLYTSINFKIKSNYLNQDSLLKITNFIKQSNIVRDVSYQKNIVEVMNKNLRNFGIVVFVISLVLILSVIILIDNTIRLAMFSERFLIKTMQYVGATRWFIALPFDKKAILNGIISSLIAIVLIYIFKTFAESWLPELRGVQINHSMLAMCTGLLLMGVLISVLSTHRSVIKYLKTSLDDLY